MGATGEERMQQAQLPAESEEPVGRGERRRVRGRGNVPVTGRSARPDPEDPEFTGCGDAADLSDHVGRHVRPTRELDPCRPGSELIETAVAGPTLVGIADIDHIHFHGRLPSRVPGPTWGPVSASGFRARRLRPRYAGACPVGRSTCGRWSAAGSRTHPLPGSERDHGKCRTATLSSIMRRGVLPTGAHGRPTGPRPAHRWGRAVWDRNDAGSRRSSERESRQPFRRFCQWSALPIPANAAARS